MPRRENASEIQSKARLPVWAIVRGVACFPSYLAFACIFAPSRYESKLWDIKKFLARPISDAQSGTHISTEIEDLIRYEETPAMSGTFRAYLRVMYEDKGLRSKQLPKKYMYFTQSNVDWELLRLQPLRYMWNESDQLALYGVAVSAILGYRNIVLHPIPEDKRLQTLCQRLPTAKFVSKNVCAFHQKLTDSNLWLLFSRHVARRKLWLLATRKLAPSLIAPVFWVNVVNFIWLLAGYCPPRSRLPDPRGTLKVTDEAKRLV
jgi:hypothetical protein